MLLTFIHPSICFKFDYLCNYEVGLHYLFQCNYAHNQVYKYMCLPCCECIFLGLFAVAQPVSPERASPKPRKYKSPDEWTVGRLHYHHGYYNYNLVSAFLGFPLRTFKGEQG